MFRRSYSSSSCPDQDGSEKDRAKYKGVRLRKWGKWVSEIRLPNSRERIWLGSYDSAEKAARAFDAAQFCLRGRNAKFNFEDSPDIDFGGSRTLTPTEIQEIASRYANNFNHNDHDEQPQGNDDGNANSDDHMGSQAMMGYETTTLPMASYSDGAFRTETLDWPPSYYDNMLESNPNVVAPGGTSSNNVPDYRLMLSSLDHLNEDMYMAPHLGTRFDDDNNGHDDQNVDEQYSQQSFLWNF